MYKQNIIKSSILLVLLILGPVLTYAQYNPVCNASGCYSFKNSHGKFEHHLSAAGMTDYTVNLPEGLMLQKTVKAADLKVGADFGEDFKFGGLDFEYNVSFQLTAYDGLNGASNTVNNVFEAASYDLTLNSTNPEGSFVKDFSPFSSAGDFTFKSYKISNVTVTDLNPASVLTAAQKQQIESAIRITLSYDIEYGLDVTQPAGLTPEITAFKTANTKYVVFTWDNNGYHFPNYQFQLLRLYNISDATAQSEDVITTQVDWSKALTIETESSEPSLRIAIAEGTGYYIWRVRPIGTYYDGGIGNSKNFGSFSDESYFDANSAEISMNLTQTSLGGFPSDKPNPFFFYADPDGNTNYIYSRSFTEGNKVKEVVTYGTGLQQPVQTQTYLPSSDTTLITQNVYDFSGRPTITTLPVPKSGEPDGFEPNWVKETNGDVYTAKDFDSDVNYNNPPQMMIKQNGGHEYYSDENPDKTIPSAEGYPFSRVLFYNDGTDRVREQSGVGKTHMIGDETDGKGKTVKTYYSSTSETELVRIFGDEAPNSETVLKTITVDQNQTASVTYTSKEGKVIATCLAFQENDNTVDNGGPFEKLENEPATGFQAHDFITSGVSNDNGYTSSKRIVLLQPTPVKLLYNYRYQEFADACGSATLDCGYKIKINIYPLDCDETVTLPVLDEKLLKDGAPDADIDDLYFLEWPEFQLPPGTYIIEKKLISENAPSIAYELSKEKVQEQIEPLTNLIKGWLGQIDGSDQSKTAFYTKLHDLAGFINNQDQQGLMAAFGGEISPNFVLTSDHSMAISPAAGVPQDITLRSACCTITMDVLYTPPFNCPALPTLQMVEGRLVAMPDFEQYAIDALADCNINIYNYMEGWAPGDFNIMAYHMLTDEYIAENCNDEEAESKVQYTCENLGACWTAALTKLRLYYCETGNFDYSGSDNSLSEQFDDNNDTENNSGEKHDSHLDENNDGGNFFTNWLVGVLLSKKVRDEDGGANGGSTTIQNPGEVHLVYEFLDCAGYRFAKILDSYDPCPLPEDADGNPYQVSNGPSVQCAQPATPKLYPYRPGTTIINAYDQNNEPWFPNIYDPHYAFKYFQYNNDFPIAEIHTCYNDPNSICVDASNNRVPCNGGTLEDPVPVNFCSMGYVECPYYHECWSSGQRLSFFLLIANYTQEPYNSDLYITKTCAQMETPVSQPGGAVKSEIQVTMESKTNNCISRCEERRQEFENNLLTVLDEKCYDIGGCRTADPATWHVIPEQDIPLIVGEVVEQCKTQCTISTYTCQENTCRPLDLPITQLGEPILEAKVKYGVASPSDPGCATNGNCNNATLTYCQKHKHDQAKGWQLDLDLPSVCTGTEGERKFSCAPGNNTCDLVNGSYATDNLNVPPDASSGAAQQKITEAVNVDVTIQNGEVVR